MTSSSKSQSQKMQIKTKTLETINKHYQSQIQSQFPVGSKVEVSTDEDGFRGAWFLATVLKPPPARHSQQHSNKLFVEYNTLLADENGSALLREFVELDFVRPLPPVDNSVEFHVDDVVDAYYQDGWWCGVVTQVVDVGTGTGREYRVFFMNPPDEIVFKLEDLRVHRVWSLGVWLLPHNHQRMSNLDFNPGTAVEVNIDAYNSFDVWFPAKVVKQVSKSIFLVEYQSSAEAGLQKIGVDSLHIRPSPPSQSDVTFCLLEKVDAFCDYRWLTGIITKILADGRFIVYFKFLKKEKELCRTALRLHMEWTNGKWILSSQDTSMISKSEKQSIHPIGGSNDKICAFSEDSLAVKENNGHVRISAVTPGCSEKESQTTVSEKADYISLTQTNKQNKQTNANYDGMSSKSYEQAVSDAAPSPEIRKPNAKQTDFMDTSVDVNTSAPDNQGESSLKQSEDSSLPSDPTKTQGFHEKFPITRKRGRPAKPRVLPAEIVDETSTRSELVKPLAPAVIDLTHTGRIIESIADSSGSRHNSDTIDEGKQLVASADHETVKEGEVTNLKRKRGRPIWYSTNSKSQRKELSLLSSTKTKEAVPERVGKKSQDVNVEGSPVRPFLTDEVEKPPEVTIADSSGSRHNSDTIDEGKQLVASADHETVKEGEVTNLKRKRGRPIWYSTNSKSQRKELSLLSSTMTKEAVPERVGKKSQDVNVEGSPVRPSLTDEVEKPPDVVEPLQMVDSTELARITSNRLKRVGLNSSKRSSSGRQVGKRRKIPVAADVEPAIKSILRGKKLEPIKQSELPGEDAGDSSREAVEDPANGLGGVVNTAVGVSSSNGFDDDRPLSAWLEVVHSPLATDGNTSCDNDSTIRQDETPLLQSNSLVAREDKELPFEKTSVVWEMIETMEVLQRIPQNPHFRPLYDRKEECREGLAIGSMVTFTNLAEKISVARLEDPKSVLDGYLEALEDLEQLGFDVVAVKEVLHKLVSIKTRYELARNRCTEIEMQMMEREQEKSKIDEEIDELEKKIIELKEKEGLAVARKEKIDGEISLLQEAEAKASMDGVESAKAEFDKVAASLW